MLNNTSDGSSKRLLIYKDMKKMDNVTADHELGVKPRFTSKSKPRTLDKSGAKLPPKKIKGKKWMMSSDGKVKA